MIKSVAKAVDVLHLFSSAEPRLTLADISRRMGIPKSTAHNILATLVSTGCVERVGDDYCLGRAIMPLTQAIRVNVELRDRAAPLLRRLADESRQSVYLTVRDGDYCLYIYAIESSNRLLARTAVGDRVHMHCTSVGKAMLSALPRTEVEGIVERQGLPAFTENTITELGALQAEMKLSRERGYAIDNAEHENHVYCIGAPILGERGEAVGSCSISGSEDFIVADRRDEYAGLVMEAAHEISRRMGFVPARVSAVLAVASAS